MKSPTIETERYIIRPFREPDATLWQVWDIDEEVQAHMPDPPNKPQDIGEQYAYIKECEADKTGYYWSIETKAGETIGTVALTDINEYHKLAEIGIIIGEKSWWGKGVATEVVGAVVKYAFGSLGIVRVNAEAEADNIGIAKVLENVGFVQDGHFVSARAKKGTRVDVKHYGIVNGQ
jgi:ribosomal-protein-alanine N-acetyltransferase